MKERIRVMLSGIGNVGRLLAETLLADERFELMLEAFGAEGENNLYISDTKIVTVHPSDRADWLADHHFFKNEPAPIVLDFSHPTAVLTNARFYQLYNLPFVMGTTGNNRTELQLIAESSKVPSLIAPNMCLEIVWLTMLLEHGQFLAPKLFANWQLQIVESHQAKKVDPSGTALALAKNIFIPMGAEFSQTTDMQLIRHPGEQLEIGVPDNALTGHGWHTYMLTDPSNAIQLGFVHNINGRNSYVSGTIEAALFVANKVNNTQTGTFTMKDVLLSKSVAGLTENLTGKFSD